MIDLEQLDYTLVELHQEAQKLGVAFTILQDIEDFKRKVIPTVAMRREQKR